MGDKWRPISFFSKKLTPTETKYSTFGRELVAAYLVVRNFRNLLEGRNFYILTYHKPLLGAFQSGSDRYSPHETRHLDDLIQFTSDIRFIKGCENVPADAMSRRINALLLNLLLTICGGTKEGPATASAGQHYITKVVKDICAEDGPWDRVRCQHRTITPLCARNFTEDIVFPHAWFIAPWF